MKVFAGYFVFSVVLLCKLAKADMFAYDEQYSMYDPVLGDLSKYNYDSSLENSVTDNDASAEEQFPASEAESESRDEHRAKEPIYINVLARGARCDAQIVNSDRVYALDKQQRSNLPKLVSFKSRHCNAGRYCRDTLTPEGRVYACKDQIMKRPVEVYVRDEENNLRVTKKRVYLSTGCKCKLKDMRTLDGFSPYITHQVKRNANE
ncbi:uncharacterized protein LOC106652594 [Trichogramma pretiosum]|uniref:uncharacterized protein LOC106652594 n=1 Tax=Trichogramma pretiosum TaxID=7493 RepID=UPI0006C9B2C0|nr:uncharacterized protein LOC106652594 [Trichogramma pretiosum]